MGKISLPTVIFGDDGQSFLSMGLSWSGNNPFSTGNISSSERYVAIVQVKDYVRLSRRLSGEDVIGEIPENVVSDIRDGRSLLVLDLSNEGPSFQKDIFDDLHFSIVTRNIPRQSVVLVNQNRILSTDYAKTYGLNGINFVYFDYFVKLLLMRLAGHAMFGESSREEVSNYSPGYDPDAKLLLSMNATPRWHRIIIYRWLSLHGFTRDALVSFHGANIFNPKSSSIDFSSIPPEIPAALAPYISGLEAWMPKSPIRFDSEIRKGNDLADSLETWAYRKTYCSLVTESDFFERTERITEKAIKAAGLGHPFILVGAPRSLGALSELGFELFTDVIDPAYDRDHDPVARMNAIFDLLLRLREDLTNGRERWINLTREQALFNHQHGKGPVQLRFERLIEKPLISRIHRYIDTGSF